MIFSLLTAFVIFQTVLLNTTTKSAQAVGDPTFIVNSDGSIVNSDELVEPNHEFCYIKPHKIEDVQLISEVAQIPISVENTCKEDVDIDIYTSSSNEKLFNTTEYVLGHAKMNSSTIMQIPVIIKANGQFNMNVEIKVRNIGVNAKLNQQNNDSNNDDNSETSILTTRGDKSIASWTIHVNSMREIGDVISILFYIIVTFLAIAGIYRTAKRISKSNKKSSK